MDLSEEIPFKVYTHWSSRMKPEIRRFGVFKGNAGSFAYLCGKLLEIYPDLKDRNYSIAWKDEDGDDVMISSDLELMTALQFFNFESLKLYVYCKEESKDKKEDINILFSAASTPGCARQTTGNSAGMHFGVVCDSCNKTIVGFRYKCAVCEDYDLCSQCEAAGCHPEHCMVRVPTPNMSRTLIKAALKRSRHFLKSVATSFAEECPQKKGRRDKSGERKSRGHHGSFAHGEQQRRSRGSWLETFNTYLNEFANLAGDIQKIDGNIGAKASETPKDTQEKANPASQTTETPNTASASAGTSKEPEAGCSANAETQVLPPLLPENLKVTMLELLRDLQSFIPQPVQTDVEMGQGDRKTPKPADANMNTPTAPKSAGSAKSDTSSVSSLNTEFYKDASPDKADDWTMINKEKDLMDTAVPNSAETVPPIGFNLPQEFQERVKITTGGSIYPPLNASTAVLNPQVLETRPVDVPTAPEAEGIAAQPPQNKQAAAQPIPEEKPQLNPGTQPRQRHPKPHIDAAIEQMLGMGFTNDGGWLTQLLESKDGNIAAVLDLLTPVNPKK